MSELPPGWEWTTIGEAAEVVLGQSPPGSSYNNAGDGLPFFQGKAEFGELHPTVAKWTTAPKKVAQANDVLLSVRAPVGPTNLAPTTCSIGRGLAALRETSAVDHRYLLWWMRASADELASHATGSTFAAVSGAQVRAHRLPLAPRAEQERIVAAIEEHLSRLDAAESAVRTARRRVTAFDRTILARAQGEGRESSVGDLLDDIEAGKSFKTPGRKAEAEEWGVIKVSAMTWGEFDEHENKAVPPSQPVDPRYEIRPGDLLLSRANTSEYVGATVLVGACRPKLLLSDKSMRLVPRPEVNRRWLRFALGSPQLRSQMSLLATGTSDSMRNISQAKVRSLRIRVPNDDRQVELADEIEGSLRSRGRLEADLRLASSRAAGLRRAVLAAAFSGRLVPQDPADEPASVLLDRIRAERAAAVPTKRTRKAKAS